MDEIKSLPTEEQLKNDAELMIIISQLSGLEKTLGLDSFSAGVIKEVRKKILELTKTIGTGIIQKINDPDYRDFPDD